MPNSRTRVERRRQADMRWVQEEVERLGGHPGKIDWETAEFMWGVNKPRYEIASRMVAIQKEDGITL